MINNLQVLRGIAALMVVLHHMRGDLATIWPGAATVYFGAAGVDVFFVLSGVVIGLSVMAPNQRAGPFLLRRALRIVPLYWAVTCCVVGLSWLGLEPLGHGGNGISWMDAVRSLTFVPFERAPDIVMPVVGVGWTLNFEVFFYSLASLALIAPARVRIFTLMSVLCAVVCAGFALQIGLPARIVPLSFNTSPMILEFGLGLILARFWLRADTRPVSATWGFCLCATGLGLLILHMTWPSFSTLHPWRVAVFGIPSALIVGGAMVMERAGWRANNRIWLHLGAASFAIYLTHPLVLQAIGKLVPAQTVLGAILTVGGVVIVGCLTHRLIEHPILIHLREVREKRRPGSTLNPESPRAQTG